MNHEHLMAKGFIGIVSPISGVVVTALVNIEIWLRIASLLVGMAVGVITFISIWKGISRRNREEKRWED